MDTHTLTHSLPGKLLLLPGSGTRGTTRPLCRLTCAAACLLLLVLLPACPPEPPPPVEAIGLSTTQLNIDLSTLPHQVQVWNTNATFANLTLQIQPSHAWIRTDVNQVTSARPSGGQFDRQTVTISIDRSILPVGTHQGSIRFTAPGVITKAVVIRVEQQTGGTGTALNIVNPVFTYAAPYLVDMHFSLKDGLGRSVVAEPAQFDLTAREGFTVVTDLNGLQLKRAAARQFKANLVLDYSLGMQQVPGAINAMQNAAKNILLPALNVDAQVGIWEFHRDDQAPQQVADFTIDRNFLRSRIDAIQSQFVQGFFSGSRAWDAMVLAARTFNVANPQHESRYLILFSDGNDTSSTNNVNDVVREANNRGVRIYAVAFGQNVNFLALQDITTRTGGLYFPTQNVGQVDEVFRDIVHDLDGQYNLRWASLKRDSASFNPSFTLGISGNQVNYTAPLPFRPTDHAGDVLQGRLRLVPSTTQQATTVFLRAAYVPRVITRMELFVRSDFNFNVQLVGATDDGLLAGWSMSTTGTPQGGMSIELQSPNNEPVPFASFGAILRFNFGVLETEATTLFDTFYVENSIYQHGQWFSVDGFQNVLPED